jgi:hypothetical protein
MNSIAIDQQGKKIQPIDGAIDFSAKEELPVLEVLHINGWMLV